MSRESPKGRPRWAFFDLRNSVPTCQLSLVKAVGRPRDRLAGDGLFDLVARHAVRGDVRGVPVVPVEPLDLRRLLEFCHTMHANVSQSESQGAVSMFRMKIGRYIPLM